MDNLSDSLQTEVCQETEGLVQGRRKNMEKKQDIVHDITVTCVVVILNSYCMSATV